jgi:glutathione S-transferase
MTESRLPTLYSFRRCPYAMRARMALAAAGIAVELREILLSRKPAQMLRLSPKGTVPVLELSNGVVLDESLDLMRWALQQNDPLCWLQTPPQLAQSLLLIADNDQRFKPLLDRYKYYVRHPELSQQEHRAQACAQLAQWELRLQGSQGGLCGAQMSIADVAIFPFVRQFSAVEPEWWSQRPFPALAHWLDTWTDSELFRRVMLKRPLWKDGQPAEIVRWDACE